MKGYNPYDYPVLYPGKGDSQTKYCSVLDTTDVLQDIDLYIQYKEGLLEFTLKNTSKMGQTTFFKIEVLYQNKNYTVQNGTDLNGRAT